MRYLASGLSVVVVIALIGVAGCSKKPIDVQKVAPERSVEETPQVAPDQGPTWPLTGLAADTVDATDVRVVSIKVENSREARPQTNLQLADVVYESVTEGGITRFNAIFHSQAPDTVGPVRSARLSDLDIVPQYRALFAFAGANKKVRPLVEQSEIDSLSTFDGVTIPYRRSTDREAPHNLYTSVSKLREEGERRGMRGTLKIDGLAFGAMDPASGAPGKRVDIPFSGYNQVTWVYDESAGAYRRENDDEPFTDAGTGEQVSARNIVVMWAKHVPDIGQTLDIILAGGAGRVTVFREGRAYRGTWEADDDSPPTFKAEDGAEILLSPGNTWFQVVDVGIDVTTQ